MDEATMSCIQSLKIVFSFSCMSNVIVMCLQYCKGLSIKLYSGILVMDIRYTAVMECD